MVPTFLLSLNDKLRFKEKVTYTLRCFCAKMRHFKDAMTVKLTVLNILQIPLPLEGDSILCPF